jgi:hypothetical protein
MGAYVETQTIKAQLGGERCTGEENPELVGVDLKGVLGVLVLGVLVRAGLGRAHRERQLDRGGVDVLHTHRHKRERQARVR